MDFSYFRYVVGTKDRPTEFLDAYGNLTDDIENALLLYTLEDVNKEIGECDNPERFTSYKIKVTIEGV